ncbi:MAG: phosphate/phosphite/phosphonate ABC transporter substrate-binding protein [Sulfuritalea sp.]|nr:phosphate/phosphite/phosphonate ABC transporter substrate-binding protein [Sulfuritalea sp.]
MIRRMMNILFMAAALGFFLTGQAWAQATWSFGVLNQRSALLTANYWNPILLYVSRKSGVPLDMKMGRTAPETSAMIGRGEFDFVYSNTIFTPLNAPAGYKVFARPIEPAIQGQIVVPEGSPIKMLKDLDGKEVGFPSTAAFVGYAVPMNALLHAGVKVTSVFAGNQEGIMGQMKAGRIMAAGVNSTVMRDYGHREHYRYRVLWTSEDYFNLPISAHPRVPAEKSAAVRDAFLGMAGDPEGLKVLEASAATIKQQAPYGFVAASDKNYQNYLQYFKTTLVTDCDGCPGKQKAESR